MLKLVHYLNDRGGHALLMDIEKPSFKAKTLQDIFEEVLKHEQYITASINDLYEVCLKAKDYTTGNFLHWYINEQIEEESLVNSILDKMRLAGNDRSGLFHIDKELASLAAAESAGGEEA
jgi:ferritin